MSTSKPVAWAAGGVAAVVLAFGAYTIGSNTSGTSSSGTAVAAQSGGAAQVPQSGATPQNGQAPPGFGTPVSGTPARKAAAAATARYSGQVEQVMKLKDGSYVVHVITSGGEKHVAVSQDFKVTGVEEGPPGMGGAQRGPSGSTS
jgi:hypothetical protein